jgi:HlyD family secretion protein
MNRARRVIVILFLVLAAGYLGWRAWAPRPQDEYVLSGYIEGENLYLAAPIAGSIATMSVARGDRVTPGETVFTVDAAQLRAERDQAAAAAAAAQAQVATAEARLTQSRASLAAATAQAENAARDLARYRSAQRENPASVAQQQVDTAIATAGNTAGQRDAAESDVKAQAAQIAAAEAQLRAQQAALADAESKLDQLAPRAPVAARVQDVFFQQGEWAAANQPVVSLLPDDKVKVRFFVPEQDVARYHLGDTIHFSCDGCAAGLSARVIYISAQPEFTPPIIYSRSSRDRLVFLMEALPGDPKGLTPGLPVDVVPFGDRK